MTWKAMLRGVTRLLLVASVLVTGSGWVNVNTNPLAAQTGEATATEAYRITFPVGGPHSFTDTFGAPRPGGRTHQGIDVFAEKLTPVVAAMDGTVRTVSVGERSGRYIVIEHADGWRSYYLHLNNDTPGTDDGLFDEPVSGIVVGAKVNAGDLLDYVGDSGNAESTPSHLHFELHGPDGQVVNPFPHLLAADAAPGSDVSVTLALPSGPVPETLDTVTVGHYDPGSGFAAGIWVHSGVAYLGTWGRSGACPATGVRMVDVADPANPRPVGSIGTGDEFAATDTDSVWAGAIDSAAFTGDVAVIAVRLCDNRERNRRHDDFRGFAVYDVTDPEQPELLGTFDSGAGTQGAHDIDVVTRDDGRVLVATTVMQSFLHTGGLKGDVRIVDITNPRHPLEISDWDFRRDAPEPDVAVLLEQVEDEELHAHSVSFTADGRGVWVANWDAGSILLNIDDPVRPTLAVRVRQTASEEGNVHSVLADDESGLLIVSSEDLYPEETENHRAGWGYQTVLDGTGSRLAAYSPTGIAPEGEAEAPLDGIHTAHDAEMVGSRLYTAWYSDGVRIMDLSHPTRPEEVGFFIPPPTADPQGYWTAANGEKRFAMVWGVHVADGLLYVSDMNSGLWIARFTGDDAARPIPS